METLFYILFNIGLFLSPFFILGLYIYLIFRIYKSSSILHKSLFLVSFFILANSPIGKLPLEYLKIDETIYAFQTCDANFMTRNIQFDSAREAWKDKNGIDVEFAKWKENNLSQKDAILYRVFEFHWWEFWEYYTYFTSDMYKYPILPADCTLKSARYYGKDGFVIY